MKLYRNCLKNFIAKSKNVTLTSIIKKNILELIAIQLMLIGLDYDPCSVYRCSYTVYLCIQVIQI